MGANSKRTQFKKNRLLLIVQWLLTTVIGLIFLAIAVLQLPVVQTYLVSNITNYVYKKTGHKAEVKYVNISWFDQVYVEDVTVYDYADSILLAAKKIEVDFDLIKILKNREVKIERIEVKEGSFHLIKHDEANPLNINVFLSSLKSSEPRRTDKQASELHIDEIDVWNSSFQLDDYRFEPINAGFDQNHLLIDSVRASINDLQIIDDTIQLNITSFAAVEGKGLLKIKRMDSRFMLTANSISFDNLFVETEKSVIKDQLRFTFNDIAYFSYFVDSVNFDVELNESLIHTDELSLFVPALKDYHLPLTIGGKYYGNVGNFQADHMLIGLGNDTKIRANCFITGLPNIKETFMEIAISNSKVNVPDLVFIPGVDSMRVLEEIGGLNVNASFLGFINDFVANGEFFTRAGLIKTDINLKGIDDFEKAKYSGSVSTSKLNVGRLTGLDKFIGNISMSGDIKGKGLTIPSADFTLKSFISQLEANGYNYQNIKTDGAFKSQFFDGTIEMRDPNLEFSMEGTVDVRKGREQINAKAQLDTLHLKPLGFSEKDILVSTGAEISLNGLSVDDITGFVKLQKTRFSMEDEVLSLDSLVVNSSEYQGFRTIQALTRDAKININGPYKLSVLANDLRSMSLQILQKLKNESMTEVFVNNGSDINYQMEFDVNIANANRYINPFFQDFYVSNDLSLSGAYSHQSNANFTLNTKIDSLSYRGSAFSDVELEFNASRIVGEEDILALFYVSSSEQKWGNGKSENLAAEAIWSNDRIDLSINIEQPEKGNYIDLIGDVKFLKDTINLRIANANILLRDQLWQVAEDNLIEITRNKLQITHFGIHKEGQNFQADGQLSDSSQLEVQIENFQLGNLEGILPIEISGLTNGDIYLRGNYATPFVTGKVSVDSLSLQEFAIGDLNINAAWNNDRKKLALRSKLSSSGQELLGVLGNIDFSTEQRSLALDVKLQDVAIEPFSIFVDDYVSDLRGTVIGDLKILGELNNPSVTGGINISNGHVKLDYLNVPYDFNGKVLVHKDRLEIAALNLFDEKGSKGYFEGAFYHQNYKDFRMAITGNVFGLNLLNTSMSDNSLYYGEAYATGSVGFNGTLSNLKISADAKTNKNTKIYIPLSNSATTDLKDYISFVNLSDTSNLINIADLSDTNLKGIELDLDLEVTPDAYIELIFDLKSGDIIRGRGEGNLNLIINTEGDFKMVGDVVIQQGGYNFTLYNLINKEFIVQQGSKISWYGNPYEGVLDIKAAYEQTVSYNSMAPNATQSLGSYPAVVILDLQGQMLSPNLDFDIEFRDYPEQKQIDGVNLSFLVKQFELRIQNDEQELKRQVFSLLILKKLMPQNSNFDVQSADFGSSVSEFISNQLSYWINQVDENLELEFDLNLADQTGGSGTDGNGSNSGVFQLRLSYTFLNGRLRVTREGEIVSSTSNSDLSNVIGDITVEYLLTQDGRLRAKVYSKSSQLEEHQRGIGFETGASIQYVRAFDYIQEVFKKNRSRRTKFVDEEGNVVKTIE